MKISYNWLQNYFDEKLPPPEKLAELLTFSFAEIENVTQTNADTVFDIKVLPDRACYALSHRGVAYEVSAITGLPKKKMDWPQPEVKKTRQLSVKVEAPELCPRYMARVVENVTQKEMPWVKEHLEAIGQRSINPIVDGANVVMFDMGQPLHAFDADKLEGGIIVRRARKGENITTLDNREMELDKNVLVIADEKSPLAIAGIKGGKKAEVNANTKNIVLESANFDASYIRKTAERLGIKTDASKRFENRLSSSLAAIGISDFTAYLYEMDKNISAGEIIDALRPYSNVLKNIRIRPGYIGEKLGLKIKETDIERALARLSIGVQKEKEGWLLTPPAFRMDLAIPEDIAEEVGRLIGYDKIPSELPPRAAVAEIPKSFYWEWKIREILARQGFSEVMTSSFAAKGDIAILKPLAEDKKFARADLRTSFAAALKQNTLNALLLGEELVRIFEIGHVFPKSGEHTALAIGVGGSKKKAAGAVEDVAGVLNDMLGVALKGEIRNGVLEVNLDTIIVKLPEPAKWDIAIPKAAAEKFTPFSQYPFIVRDVALFVPPDAEPEEVGNVIKQHAGNLVVRGPELFDEFSKDGKKSLAFRLVFQAFDRTLTDEEVNVHMARVCAALKQNGWQVR